MDELLLLHGVYDNIALPVWIFDVDSSHVLWANQAALKIWDANSLGELKNRDMSEDMSPTVKQRLYQYLVDFKESDVDFREQWTLYPRGQPVTLNIRFSGIQVSQSKHAILCEGHDSEQPKPDAIRGIDALLHTQLMISLHVEYGETLYMNPVARRTFNTPNSDLSDRFCDPNDYLKLMSDIKSTGNSSLISKVFTSTGEKWHEIIARPCFDPISGKPSVLISASDVSELKAAEARAHQIAYTDALTKLPNRRSLTCIFDRISKKCKHDERLLSIQFLDLDEFKAINDTLGHKLGDRVLIETAQRLQSIVSVDDEIVRLGGDEFLLFIQSNEISEATNVAEKVIDALSHPITLKEANIRITPSIGISFFQKDGDTIDSLMQYSDIAMYRAKSAGKNRYCVFRNEMKSQLDREQNLLKSIKQESLNEQFRLYFQPRFDIKTKQINSLEALIRWEHPIYGMLYPEDFIPLLEKSNLIDALGCWVIEKTIQQLSDWRQRSIFVSLSVNVSITQLHCEDFSKFILDYLEQEQLPPESIELELTETSMFKNSAAAQKNIENLNAAGIKFAIDDFGTGYSNLARLTQMPVNCIKLDKSLIKSLPKNEKIVGKVVEICHTMNASVVAEGVETQEVAYLCQQLGCEELQGFFIAEALPSEDVEKLLLDPPQII
ncbi:putative bifunctional diguanylate cyclase/phosphodiesterase [Marinomonas balearica]|uniref:Diguanylate cyclase/phosphodiesterase n=1 Tax=Marinomonas balearica TaxID=491947 RepID=A0A4R6M8E4_9GAMM|nr:EAL domain-containing protein [Marinomonas balearica]TDO96870.1 diguanylate cyclase/phosphodiesterase [Marinomonas balearica]